MLSTHYISIRVPLMNTKEYELNLFKQTLEWARTQPKTEPYLPYYDEYITKASTHTPILSEDWGKFNLRHGPNSIRGTTSELLTTVALSTEGYEIHQVTSKVEQNYGTDLKASKGALEYVFSIKTTKPRYIEQNQANVELTLYREYFEPAQWRVNILSLVHPESKQLWLINYPLVGNMHCTITDRGLFAPAFKEQSVRFPVNELKTLFPHGIQYIDLNKGN